MTAPERSLKQRHDALDRANEIRTYRARLKRNLKAGRVSAGTLLANPPAQIETMKLWDLIVALPKYGRVKTNKVLAQCRISPSKTIGGLSQRQRDEMLAFLRITSTERKALDRFNRTEYQRDYRALCGPVHHGHASATTADMADTACGSVLEWRRVTTDEDRVTCRTCRRVLALSTALV